VRSLPAHAPLVATTRGGSVECVHYGSIAVVDAGGRLVAGCGDTTALQFTRSALKPLQALPLVQDDGIGRLGFGSHELALMCASHNGEAVHVGIVRRMLARIDAGASDLQCGCHDPMYYAATSQRAPASSWGQEYHNCSGKHTGFLAYCRLHRHPLSNYLDPDSPLQMRIRNTVQEFAGAAPLASGIDGCGAPNHALPLDRLATAYARIATADDGALRALFYAMTRHPDLVSGTGRGDLALMRAGAARGEPDWVAKVGAEGVQAIGIRSQGLGIAVRIADGNARALQVATGEVLRQLRLVDAAAAAVLDGGRGEFGRPAIRNYAGRVVGGVEPVFTLDVRATR